jgi:hypothetical protein
MKVNNPTRNKKATPPTIPPMMAPFRLDFPARNCALRALNWRDNKFVIVELVIDLYLSRHYKQCSSKTIP